MIPYGLLVFFFLSFFWFTMLSIQECLSQRLKVTPLSVTEQIGAPAREGRSFEGLT